MIVCAIVCASAVPAVPAQASPERLKLETTPPSSPSGPANNTTPFIHEDKGEKTKNVVGPSARTAAVTALADPANTVAIYTDSDCKGSVVATGTLAEFEDPGIQVEVAPDTTTTFYAAQTEVGGLEEASECSQGITYYESSTVAPPGEEQPAGGDGGGGPSNGSGSGSGSTSGSSAGVSPAVPVTPEVPRIQLAPGGPANDNTPSVSGSAPGAERVKVFVSDSCGGIPLAEAPGGQFSTGAALQVPDDSETTFTALGVAGSVKSKCSAPVTYVEDSTAPLTGITMGPGAKTRKRKVVFRFADTTSNAPGTTFQCKLDHAGWQPCFSPFKIKRLAYRRHTLRIRATDIAGNFEKKPIKRSFKVVRNP